MTADVLKFVKYMFFFSQTPLTLWCFILSPFKDAHKFGAQIRKALHDLIRLLSPAQKEPNKTEESKTEVKKDL